MKVPTGMREAVDEANAAMDAGADEWRRHLLNTKLPRKAHNQRRNIIAIKRLLDERMAVYCSQYGVDYTWEVVDRDKIESIVCASLDVPSHRYDAELLWESIRGMQKRDALDTLRNLAIRYRH